MWLDNELVVPNTRLEEGADPYDPASYSRYTLKQYAPDLMLQEALGFIADSRDEPFFLYFATPIPHLPLQAPRRWVEHYLNKFGDEEPYTGDQSYFPHRYPHAAYAAMVSYLDSHVGRLLQELKDLNLEHEFLYWEFSSTGQQAVRMGRWKGLRKGIREGDLEIALYDLENDLQEQQDLSGEHPEIVGKIREIMEKEHVPSSIERFRLFR